MAASIKNKILFPIISVVLVTSLLIIGVFSISMYNKSISDAQNNADAVSKEMSGVVSKDLSRAIYTTKTFAQVFENYKIIPETIFEKYNYELLKRVEDKNRDFLSVGISWQLFAIDENRIEEYGRRRITMYRDAKGELKKEDILKDMTGEDSTSLFYKIKKENTPVIVEPYVGSFNNEKDFLMTSICFPVQENGKFLGLAVTDISLKKLQNIVIDSKDKNGKLTFLLSNSGIFLANNDEKLLGKSIKEQFSRISQKYNLENKIKQGLSFSFTDKIKDSVQDYYVSMCPVPFGENFQPWSIVTIVPISAITKDAKETMKSVLLLGFISILIMITVIYFIAKSITNPLLKTISFAKELSDGNLNAIYINKRKDEIGKLGDSLILMSGKIREIILKAKNTAHVVEIKSKALQLNSEKIYYGASKQAVASEEISSTMEEMSANIIQSSEHAMITSKTTDKTAIRIKRVSKSVEDTAVFMKQIDEKLKDMEEISFKTKLLSLNSAIEAAHAGVYGKGFTVVAREIRKLADKVKLSAHEMKLMSAKSVDMSTRSAELLNELVPEIQDTTKLIQEITLSAKEQSQGSIQVNNALTGLSAIIQQNAGASEEMVSNLNDLSKLAEELRKVVEFFKT